MSSDETRRSTEAYLQDLTDSCAAVEVRNKAAEVLFERLQPLVRGIVVRFGFQQEEVDDAMGDLSEKLCQSALGYDPTKGEFRALVGTFARTWALERLRKRKAHRDADRGSGDSDIQRRLSEEPDKVCEEFSSVLAELVDKEMRKKFREADHLARQELNDRDREIVRLVYDEGLTPKEAVTRLTIQPADVYQVTFHHRQRVLQIFLGLGGTESWGKAKWGGAK